MRQYQNQMILANQHQVQQRVPFISQYQNNNTYQTNLLSHTNNLNLEKKNSASTSSTLQHIDLPTLHNKVESLLERANRVNREENHFMAKSFGPHNMSLNSRSNHTTSDNYSRMDGRPSSSLIGSESLKEDHIKNGKNQFNYLQSHNQPRTPSHQRFPSQTSLPSETSFSSFNQQTFQQPLSLKQNQMRTNNTLNSNSSRANYSSTSRQPLSSRQNKPFHQYDTCSISSNEEKVKAFKVDDFEGNENMTLGQCQAQIRSLQVKNNKLKVDLEEAMEGKQYYRKELSLEWRNNKKMKDELENKIYTLEATLTKQREEYKIHLSNKQFAITDLVNKITDQKKQYVFEVEFEKLGQSIKENEGLVQEIEKKETQILSLNSQIYDCNEKIQDMKEKIQSLEAHVQQLMNVNPESLKNDGNFGEMIKLQQKTNLDFKGMIERLNEKNNDLRGKLLESNKLNECHAHELKIRDLKLRNILKNKDMETAKELTNKQNTMSNLERKVSTLQQKYKSCQAQAKTKDDFLKQYLIGRTDDMEIKDYIQSVLSKYSKRFTQDQQQQMKQKLIRAEKKLELYQRYK